MTVYSIHRMPMWIFYMIKTWQILAALTTRCRRTMFTFKQRSVRYVTYDTVSNTAECALYLFPKWQRHTEWNKTSISEARSGLAISDHHWSRRHLSMPQRSRK